MLESTVPGDAAKRNKNPDRWCAPPQGVGARDMNEAAPGSSGPVDGEPRDSWGTALGFNSNPMPEGPKAQKVN